MRQRGRQNGKVQNILELMHDKIGPVLIGDGFFRQLLRADEQNVGPDARHLVKELWTRWLAYDFPRERVEAAAAEMTYAYRKTKGERVVTDGGIETIKELYSRGYTLGIVSDHLIAGKISSSCAKWLMNLSGLFSSVTSWGFLPGYCTPMVIPSAGQGAVDPLAGL